MPYAGRPFVQAVIAVSTLYLLVPGATGVIGSAGTSNSGAWWLAGPVVSHAPCMSYVMTLAKSRIWPTLSVSMFLILS